MCLRNTCTGAAAGSVDADGNGQAEPELLFMFSLCCLYMNLEHVRIHVVYRVNQTRYVMVVPSAYVCRGCGG